MDPNNQPDRRINVPPRRAHNTQDQAASVVRHQIDQVYENDPPNQTAEPAENPYQRTHQENFDWRKYHSAWQQYYQQYYQRYYWQQLHAERQKLAATTAEVAAKPVEAQIITGHDPAAIKPNKTEELKQDITNKVKERATKLRRSHHFIPIASALAVGLIFLFLQFNRVLVAQVEAYVSPGKINADAVVIDPGAVKVGPEPRLIIPKINVDLPLNFGVKSLDENTIQQGLKDGAVHYNLPGANAVPGQFGNTVILGHSSNDIFNQGQYKFVFVLLDRLQKGDIFYVHYKSTRYIYKMTDSKVIQPNDISALQIGNSKPMITLITCTPPGTALNRLLVFAEQISPEPKTSSKPAPTQPAPQQEATLPDNGKSFLQQLWESFF